MLLRVSPQGWAFLTILILLNILIALFGTAVRCLAPSLRVLPCFGGRLNPFSCPIDLAWLDLVLGHLRGRNESVPSLLRLQDGLNDPR